MLWSIIAVILSALVVWVWYLYEDASSALADFANLICGSFFVGFHSGWYSRTGWQVFKDSLINLVRMALKQLPRAAFLAIIYLIWRILPTSGGLALVIALTCTAIVVKVWSWCQHKSYFPSRLYYHILLSWRVIKIMPRDKAGRIKERWESVLEFIVNLTYRIPCTAAIGAVWWIWYRIGY